MFQVGQCTPPVPQNSCPHTAYFLEGEGDHGLDTAECVRVWIVPETEVEPCEEAGNGPGARSLQL